MNEDQTDLLEDLHALGSDGPREAPLHVEEFLQAEFRRQKRHRKLVAWVPSAGVAAAAVIGLLIWSHGNLRPSIPGTATVSVAAEDESESGFFPLPEAEALPAIENAMVVRVQLPVSSLRLMGVPMSEESEDAAVQAELLLGQDGLARGVRLVQ